MVHQREQVALAVADVHTGPSESGFHSCHELEPAARMHLGPRQEGPPRPEVRSVM